MGSNKDSLEQSPEELKQREASLHYYSQKRGEGDHQTHESNAEMNPNDLEVQKESLSFTKKPPQDLGLPQQYLERSDEKEGKATQKVLETRSSEEEKRDKVGDQFYSFSPSKKPMEKNISVEYPSFGNKTEGSKVNTQNNSHVSRDSHKIHEDLQKLSQKYPQTVLVKHNESSDKEEVKDEVLEKDCKFSF